VPRNPNLPELAVDDNCYLPVLQMLRKIVDDGLPPDADFQARSSAMRRATLDVLWLDEEQRLRELVTNERRIVCDGEPYVRLSQQSGLIVHGLAGSHVVDEALYRREGVHNGPTVKPLVARLGLIDGCLLPDLASHTGAMRSSMTDREAHAMLVRLGFRPPSRAVLERHVGGLYEEMSLDPRALEDTSRTADEIDFSVGAISCGMDRMATLMDETLPEGPARDEKLRARAKRAYQRTPPEPYETAWRMVQTANVTLYDEGGRARRTLRYAVPADDKMSVLAERVVDDVMWALKSNRSAPVVCVQDGAVELDVLRRCLRERLPEYARREHVVDFHHAISYLDAVVANCEPAGDPSAMGYWYRTKLLKEERGIDDILRSLLRRRASLKPGTAARESVVAAIRYCGKRRNLMRYASLHRDGLPIGSGATESGCALFQLRVKHPGSHWRRRGLAGVLTARGLALSGRWDMAFDALHKTLCAEVRAA
jgi:hypothetical protein